MHPILVSGVAALVLISSYLVMRRSIRIRTTTIYVPIIGNISRENLLWGSTVVYFMASIANGLSIDLEEKATLVISVSAFTTILIILVGDVVRQKPSM